MAIINRPVPRVLIAIAVAVFAFGAAIALTLQGPSQPKAAWANMTVNLNPGNVPTNADDFTNDCDPNQGGGPLPGQDIWVFVLPGNHATSGDFVSVTAHFQGHPDQTITVALNPGNFSNGGPETSKAWIITPAGWILTGAEAEITGTADFFNLTHTCPAATPSPSTSPSMSHSPSPSPSASMSHSPSPSTSPSRSHSPRPSMSTKPGYGYHPRSESFWSRAIFG